MILLEGTRCGKAYGELLELITSLAVRGRYVNPAIKSSGDQVIERLTR